MEPVWLLGAGMKARSHAALAQRECAKLKL